MFWVRMRFVFARQQHVHMLNHKKATINNQQNAGTQDQVQHVSPASSEKIKNTEKRNNTKNILLARL